MVMPSLKMLVPEHADMVVPNIKFWVPTMLYGSARSENNSYVLCKCRCRIWTCRAWSMLKMVMLVLKCWVMSVPEIVLYCIIH